MLPSAAQGPNGRGQLPPRGPAPPSNLTPSLAQGGQPYSAAQQVRDTPSLRFQHPELSSTFNVFNPLSSRGAT